MKWNSVLTWSGIGSFTGFLIAVALYSLRNIGNFVYLIYVGVLVGALLGLKYPVESRASAYSFPMGFLATSLLAGVWMVKSVSSLDLYLFLGIVTLILIIIGSNSLLDMFLVPITYFGGFSVAMLAFRGYEPLQGSEGAVMGLFVVGVMGAILAFFAVLGRWGFEKAKRFQGGNV